MNKRTLTKSGIRRGPKRLAGGLAAMVATMLALGNFFAPSAGAATCQGGFLTIDCVLVPVPDWLVFFIILLRLLFGL